MLNFYKKYEFPIIALAVLLLFGGYFSYSNLKTGLFPDITFPKIKIIADAGQQPIDKMMATVTVPLENIIRKTEGLENIRSTTSRGSCEISVYLSWSSDIDMARLQIQSFINEAMTDLPPGITISVEKMNPSILPVMGYSIEGNRSPISLQEIATYQVKPYLVSVPGVSDIGIIGGKKKEYQIILNPDKVTTLGIGPQQIQSAIVESNILSSNGYISDHDRMYLTLTDNSVDQLSKLQNLVIINSPNRLIKLSDIAEIKINETKEYVRINANGKDVPLIAIIKQPNANLIEVTKGVEDKIAELEKILPKDIKLIPYYKQADFVNDSIKSIEDVLWIGLILSIVVVIIFLRSVSTSIAVLLTIPLTLSLTLIILFSIGYTFNIMTLGALAASIGLMIDDAVIVVEQIHRTREENTKEPITSIISKSIGYLLPAMIGSSLSTIVIFIPFILMSGVAGAYFKVLALTMIITLGSSFIVTWIILPTLFLILPFKKKEHKDIRYKAGWIKFFVKHSYLSFIFVAICIFILVTIPGSLPSGFLPEMDEGSIVVDFRSPSGTTLEESDRMLKELDNILKEQPEVENFSRRLGTQMGFFITEPNTGDILIKLKKDRTKSTVEVSDEIRKKIEESLPQLTVDFGQVIGDMLGDLMSSVQPVEIKLFGNNKDSLESISTQIADMISTVKGTADVFNGITIAGPDILVQPDVPALAQFGITPSDFQFQLQTQIEGTVVSNFIDKEKKVNIRLIYPNALYTSVHSLKNNNILLPNGSFKPLNTVAKITIEKGQAEIHREDQKMIGIISARLNNRDLGSTLKDIQATLNEKLVLPSGFHIEYGGSYAEQQRAFKELLLILISAALLVFIVMLFLFRQITISFIVIFLAVLGAAGSFIALLITNTPLNVGSYTGIIMIIGIIGENAIFTYQQYMQANLTMNKEKAIIYSITRRLRPNLMTASAAIIALLPLALGLGTGAQLHQPLAIAVIGGFIFALPLLLVVLPGMIKLFIRDNIINKEYDIDPLNSNEEINLK